MLSCDAAVWTGSSTASYTPIGPQQEGRGHQQPPLHLPNHHCKKCFTMCPVLITDTLIFECTAAELPPLWSLTQSVCTLWYLTLCVHSHMHRSKTHISNVLCLNVWGGGGVCSQSITYFMLHHIIFWFNYFLHDFRSFFYSVLICKIFKLQEGVLLFTMIVCSVHVQHFCHHVFVYLYVYCHAHTPDSHTSQRKVECGNVTACHSLTNVLLFSHSRLMYSSFCFLGSQHHSSTSFPPSGSSHSG